MKIAVGCFMQESHSFSPVAGSWEHFGPHEINRGEEMLETYQLTRTELGAALDEAQVCGIEIVPLLSAHASASSGPQLQEVFETVCAELIDRLEKAGAIDGLFLALHGAMIAENYPDASGEVLRRFRGFLGADIPIVATLDLHANVTHLMAAMSNGLIGYHTAPHIDMYETGQRGFRLLHRMISKAVQPTVALKRLPMILPGENGRTTDGPYKHVMDMAIHAMQQPGILDASVFSVQPWLDIPEVGCSVVVISDADPELAENEAERIADEFWQRRAQFAFESIPARQAIISALQSAQKPVILSDPSDSPSSGAPGDSPVFLAELLKLNPDRECLLNIVDPAAVSAMEQTGIGHTITVKVGAVFAPQFYEPVEVIGQVRLLCDGTFTFKGPGFHGSVFHRGLTGVLQIGNISLVVMERPVYQWDPELYRSVGLEPSQAQLVQVKSPAAFRAAYEPFAAQVLLVDAPGVCSSNLASFPFKNVRRPLYPLDNPSDWRQ